MKKSFLRRILPCLLAFLLLPLSLFTSCGGQKEELVKMTNVFSSTYLDIPFEFNYVQAMSCVGDRIYLYGYGGEIYEPMLCTVRLDGSDPREIAFEVPAVFEESETGDFYVSNVVIAQDGTVWGCAYDYSYDADTDYYENRCYLLHYDADGRLLKTIDTKKELASIADKAEIDYLNSYIVLKDGRIVTCFNNALVLLSGEGKLLNTVILECDYVEKVLVDAAGTLYVVYYDYNSTDNDYSPRFRTVDTETGAVGDVRKFDSGISPYTIAIAINEGSKYDFYYTSYGSFYGFDLNTQTSTEVLNFINCDINSNYVNSTIMLDDDTAVTYSQNYSNNQLELIVLKRIPDEEVVPKVVLRLAGMYIDNTVTEAVLDFNRKSDRYRIVIEDYSRYTDEDYNLGQTRLNNDLIAGNIPDIILLSSEMPVESYISKGLFADLYPFIDKDETMGREDFLPNLLKALEVNGKLYEFTPSVTLMTVAAKTKFVGDKTSITADEFRAVMDSMPAGTMAFLDDYTRSDLLRSICTLNYNHYIDRGTGKCSFDSDNFVKLLEFSNEMNAESIYETIDWEDIDDSFWEDRENAYREDRALFQICYISDYSQYWNLIKGSFGDEISLVGMPTDSGSGSSFICNTEIAMSARSKSKDAVWEFMRYFVTEKYQDALTYNFPVLNSSIEKLAEYCMTPPELDEYGNVIYKSGKRYINNRYYTNGGQVDIGVIDQEHVDRFNAFLHSVDQVYRVDNSILDIVNEEADAYFNGQRSAKDAAAIIQNRVSLYVSESR